VVGPDDGNLRIDVWAFCLGATLGPFIYETGNGAGLLGFKIFPLETGWPF
jgi:hypothetical protein